MLRIDRDSLWLMEGRGGLGKMVFFYRPGRAFIVIITIFVQGFAVYEIFSNHHFVQSSQSL